MENLPKDPIIAFYLQLSESTTNSSSLPLFSDLSLRLSMREVFGKLKRVTEADINLYKRLLILHYSNTYKSIQQLSEIMNHEDESFITECLQNKDEIINLWEHFIDFELQDVLYREAFTEILYEWTKRYFYMYGFINPSLSHTKAVSLQKFMGIQAKQRMLWFKHFTVILASRNVQKDIIGLKDVTDEDLEIPNIYMDIKHKLNSLLEPFLPEDETEPPSKKTKSIVEDGEVCNVKVLEPKIGKKYKASESANEKLLNEIRPEIQSALENESLEMIDILEWTDEDDEQSPQEEEDEKEKPNIIDDQTALNYLSALQAYAVTNGQLKAIELIDQIDSLFRSKNENK